ncbi:MAG: DNA-binding response regulator [Verrucomicrobiales bacterium]|nr:DNA-binding response regulator [Verrucomicrobiales bacterium]
MNTNRPKETKEASAKPAFRIVLVEDKAEIRENWSKLINSFPEFKCVHCCVSAEEALRIIPEMNPDVVLMDIFLPRMSGIECVKRLKEAQPDLQIVILTAVDDDALIFLALEAGADGYLLKLTKPENLRDSLLDVLKGGAPMSSEIARRVVRFFRQKSKTKAARDDDARLSTREEEVLALLSQGYSNKEIAEQLELSVDTICSYLKRIYKKMHVRSRAQAVARYLSAS